MSENSQPMFETTTRRSFQNNSSGSQKSSGNSWSKYKSYGKQKSVRFYVCDSPHYLARDCHKNKTESQGKSSSQKTTQEPKGNKMIRTRYYTPKQRQSSCVEVKVEGIPVTGLIDTGSDITIIRGDLFYHIVETARLEDSNLKSADLKACTYDQKSCNQFGWTDGSAH